MKLKNMSLPTIAGTGLGTALALLLNKDKPKTEDDNTDSVAIEDESLPAFPVFDKSEEQRLYSDMVAGSERPYTILNSNN
jgi:hypothetical protein